MSNYNFIKKEMMKNMFTATFDKDFSGEHLNLFQLNTIFSEYSDDFEGLKNLVLDSLVNANVVDKDYFSNIVSVYADIYRKKDDSLSLENFVRIFMRQYFERKQINDIRKRTTAVFSYTGSNMFRVVYEDSHVKVSFLDGINGVFIEKKDYRINNERYYLYPAYDADGEVCVNKVDNILPERVLSELTVVTKKRVMNASLSVIEEYDRYIPNEKVSEGVWPVFTKDNFIDFSCNDSLPQEEKFNKTCEIIRSSSYLESMIRTFGKTY